MAAVPVKNNPEWCCEVGVVVDALLFVVYIRCDEWRSGQADSARGSKQRQQLGDCSAPLWSGPLCPAVAFRSGLKCQNPPAIVNKIWARNHRTNVNFIWVARYYAFISPASILFVYFLFLRTDHRSPPPKIIFAVRFLDLSRIIISEVTTVGVRFFAQSYYNESDFLVTLIIIPSSRFSIKNIVYLSPSKRFFAYISRSSSRDTFVEISCRYVYKFSSIWDFSLVHQSWGRNLS